MISGATYVPTYKNAYDIYFKACEPKQLDGTLTGLESHYLATVWADRIVDAYLDICRCNVIPPFVVAEFTEAEKDAIAKHLGDISDVDRPGELKPPLLPYEKMLLESKLHPFFELQMAWNRYKAV